MRRADRFVPICDVRKTSSVILESPPPYRQILQIDVGTLSGLLGMVGAEEDQLKLRFERQQNVVRVAPTHAGWSGTTTKETPFKEEKGRGQRRVEYNSNRQELILNISYEDREVKTPTETAKNLSRRLAGALSMVPATKYSTNFERDLMEEPPSGRAAEVILHSARAVLAATLTPISYTILMVATGAPRPWDTAGIMTLQYMINVLIDLNSVRKLIAGEQLKETEAMIATTIAAKPLRAIYPASLFEECLVPTALFLGHQAIAPTQLLRADKK